MASDFLSSCASQLYVYNWFSIGCWLLPYDGVSSSLEDTFYEPKTSPDWSHLMEGTLSIGQPYFFNL